MAVWIFFSLQPDCPKQPRIENLYQKCGSRYLCLLLCGRPLCYRSSRASQKNLAYLFSILPNFKKSDSLLNNVFFVKMPHRDSVSYLADPQHQGPMSPDFQSCRLNWNHFETRCFFVFLAFGPFIYRAGGLWSGFFTYFQY